MMDPVKELEKRIEDLGLLARGIDEDDTLFLQRKRVEVAKREAEAILGLLEKIDSQMVRTI